MAMSMSGPSLQLAGSVGWRCGRVLQAAQLLRVQRQMSLPDALDEDPQRPELVHDDLVAGDDQDGQPEVEFVSAELPGGGAEQLAVAADTAGQFGPSTSLPVVPLAV